MGFKQSLLAIVTTCSLLFLPLYAHGFEVAGKAECIAPSGPGGGWDFTCRSFSRVLAALDQYNINMQTTNMAGAGGGVAFAHTISKRAKDSDLLIAASTATTARLAQHQFPGMNADMVRWIGSIGADYGIIAVPSDSPYHSLQELVEALKQDPKSISFAGASAVGGWDHLKALMVAKSGGVKGLNKITYLSFNNGGSAVTQVVGKHVDALVGVVSSAQGFIESGDLRALAVLAEERLPGELSDIPTAKEQGIDAIGYNWRGFYMPKDAPDDAYDWWVKTLDEVYASPQWQKVMAQSGLMPFHKSGPAFDQFVHQQIEQLQALSEEIGLMKQ